MARKYIANEKGFWSLISILITLALIGYFAYFIINAYFKPLSKTGSKTTSSDEGGSSPGMVNPSVVDQARSEVDKLNQRTFDQLQQIKEINK